MLIDTATITVRAGDGGNGCVSFRREKFVPLGGPDGGDGGAGGSVTIVAREGRSTLLDFRHRRHYRAESGRHGSGAKKTGRDGEGVVIEVPVGTIVRDHDSGEVLADLEAPGSSVVVAEGGRGGRGNARFATPVDRAPRRAEEGRRGRERTVDLELKLLADVGIVGLPNAGKSTLISRLSSARPRIGDYPFTTLSPVLGLVRHADGESFVAADLPGLIEGAHQGKGLGDRFLRHVERTRVLVLLIDAASNDPESAYATLTNELSSYGQGLDEKPRLVALNKIDLLGPSARPPHAFGGEETLEISALTGEGLEALVHAVWKLLQSETSAGRP
jgi:GTP-binding protein